MKHIPMPQSALDGAPKTLKESLERAITFMETHQGGVGRYEDSKGCPCLIGSYFSKEQRAWIIDEGINGYKMYSAVHRIGHGNLLALTSMNVDQCSLLQLYYDCDHSERLIEMIQAILDGKTEQIKGTKFIL